MWPFRRRRDRDQTIRDGFSKFVTPEALEILVSDPARLRQSVRPEPGTIFFVLVHVRDDGPDDAVAWLARVASIVQESGGMIDQMSSFVLATFGIPPSVYANDPAKLSIAHCAKVASALTRELGSSLRVVYGVRDGLFGMVGGATFFHYGAMIPDFGDAADKLLRLDFGQSTEV